MTPPRPTSAPTLEKPGTRTLEIAWMTPLSHTMSVGNLDPPPFGFNFKCIGFGMKTREIRIKCIEQKNIPFTNDWKFPYGNLQSYPPAQQSRHQQKSYEIFADK